MLKDQLFKISGLQFDNWLFGPEKLSGHSRNRPQIAVTGVNSTRIKVFTALNGVTIVLKENVSASLG